MTRDIRFSEGEILALIDAASMRRRELRRSIDKAKKRHRDGDTIQRGTLDRHIRRERELTSALEALDVARRQIGHQIAARLGVS